MSKQLQRKVLQVNQRRGIVQHFTYIEPTIKSVANPSVYTWATAGRGVEGESVNSTNKADSQILRRNWRPL